ncbi:MAG: bifunctional DNA-formamidopyrimidine glycosylase/DNA-(apurinic or apyrimidinic site) lyase [Alphaproteobacteria bacterium]|nr:bifunctional DNA-formamidopyrimidine glycosylase/DNA-(apurinic or apyrimidinic site) lyase [Alphaproteobacteria bacterium SS10]
MPELPEVETVGRGLSNAVLGATIAEVDQRRPDLRWPMPENLPARLAGRRWADITRRGKYLLITMDDGQVMLLHLGMSGRMVILKPGHNAPPPEKHDHVVFDFTDGHRVVFNDPRRFGALLMADDVTAMAEHSLLAGMGPEPFDPAFTAESLSASIEGRRSPIKTTLLDQKVVAGLGNIYVCEALFLARISPRRLAHTVAGERAKRLVPAIRAVLTDAIKAGGSTLRDYVQATGELGYFQKQFAVYDREGEPCQQCDGCLLKPGAPAPPVQRIVQSNRSTFFCGHCQR